MQRIERTRYLNKLISKMNNGMIKVITGIRRSGKSYLLFNIFYEYLLQQGVADDCIVRLALDDLNNDRYLAPEILYSYLMERTADQSCHYYILLDEVP
ncbi:MAG: AAA family ATPase [Succinivibrio sp.]|nr:AAA family ATPase [Succinivibrio sp.]